MPLENQETFAALMSKVDFILESVKESKLAISKITDEIHAIDKRVGIIETQTNTLIVNVATLTKNATSLNSTVSESKGSNKHIDKLLYIVIGLLGGGLVSYFFKAIQLK